jgi:hypothetical protein
VAPWKLPLVVGAIAVPIAAAFLLGGPGVGLAAGALAAVTVVLVAVRQRPHPRIGRVPSDGGPKRLLLVAGCPVEDRATIDEIAAEIARQGDGAEALVLAPARLGFLDRWASDVDAARAEAQRRLVITVASLARVGIAAEARVGDEDLVQAVEDATASFAATDVILVTAASDRDRVGGAAEELAERLRAKFRWIALNDPSAG